MIEVSDLSVLSGHNCLLNQINFDVKQGEIMGLIGPSGAGKSTLLNAIAGFVVPNKGHIRLNGKTVCSPKVMVPPDRRKVAMVFQSLALWPHMTVQKHLEFVISDRQNLNPKAEREEQINAILKSFHLTAYRNRRPEALSGGEQQRLAIARAMAANPQYMLLDEPSSNLDILLKEELLAMLIDLKRRVKITIIYVTHSIREALGLADRISIIKQGKITHQFDRETEWNTASILSSLKGDDE